MSNLPRDVLFDVLLRLEVKDLIRCLCVSKSWYACIHDQDLIKAHLQLSIKTNSARTILIEQRHSRTGRSGLFSLAFYDNDTLGTLLTLEQPLQCRDRDAATKILGYSNGLVCIYNYNILGTNYEFAFWNPSIQKLKKIPSSIVEQQASAGSEITRSYHSSGFGYDSANDDYKLVEIVVKYSNWGRVIVSCQVQIYSLKSNSWKRIQNIGCNGFPFLSNSVSLNGALSWLMYNEFDRKQSKILTVDLASEKYREFPTPVFGDDNYVMNLEVLGGCLCICVYHWQIRNDVWIMKENGVTEWTQLYSIDLRGMLGVGNFCCRPLVFSKDGGMVLLQMDYEEQMDDEEHMVDKEHGHSLVWYDLGKKSLKQVKISGLPHYFAATICWGSLCLLDGDPVKFPLPVIKKRKFKAVNGRSGFGRKRNRR